MIIKTTQTIHKVMLFAYDNHTSNSNSSLTYMKPHIINQSRYLEGRADWGTKGV